MKRTIAVGLMLALGALAACDKSASSGGAAATETTSGGGGGSIGVKECDDYLAKADSCYKDPSMAAMKSSLATQKAAWTEAAKNPQAKAGLANGCKAALDALVSSGACK